MDYSQYTEEDFILDESFVDWYKRKDDSNNVFWEKWLAQHPEKRTVVENALRFLATLHLSENTFTEADTLLSWQRLQARLEVRLEAPLEASGEADQTEPVVVLLSGRSPWRSIAAVVSLLLVIGCAALWFVNRAQDTLAYTTGYGETRQITLPDGSVVTLNANSRLHFSRSWRRDQPREVWLQGEAFFSVVEKAAGTGEAKFRVHTDQLAVEVLGTQFDVKERRGQTLVVLNSGKIKLESALNKADSLVMKPGDLVQVSERHEKLIRRRVNPELYSSWRNNILIFDHTPLAQVASLIEDTYGLKVVFEQEAQAGKEITGNLPADNLDVLLLALSRSFNLQVNRSDNQILFSSSPE